MLKNDDKKTAIKLLNKYADEYHILQEEIKALKCDNKDLKTNLKINKEIIQSFFQRSSIDEKYSSMINKLKEENEIISTQFEKLMIERDELKAKLSAQGQIANATITKDKEDIEKLKTKIFYLENILAKKDSTILVLQNKINKLFSDTPKNIEVFISDPTAALNTINDELMTYKESNKKLMRTVKDLRSSLSKYEKLTQDLEVENAKWKQELKYQIISATALNNRVNQNKKGENISQNTEGVSQSYLKTNCMVNKALLSQFNCKTHKSENLIIEKNNLGLITNVTGKNEKTKRTIQQYEDFEENNRTRKEKVDMTEEWWDTLKHCNMTQEEFLKYCKNKLMQKLCDAIEYLYKLIVEKNIQIKLLSEQNENLNNDNLKLNKGNIQLTEEIRELVAQFRLLQEDERSKIMVAGANTKESSVSVKTIHKTKGDTGMVDSSGVIENNSNLVASTVNDSNHTGNFGAMNKSTGSTCTVKAYISPQKDMAMASDTNTMRFDRLKKLVGVNVQTLESVTSSEFREGIALDELELASDMSRKERNNIFEPNIEEIKSG